MSILNKIFTAFRDDKKEEKEKAANKNTVDSFAQKISDEQRVLEESKRELTRITEQEIQVLNDSEKLTTEIAELEKEVTQALAQNDESLAVQIAQKIAAVEAKQAVQQSAHTHYVAHIAYLKSLIKHKGQEIADLERQKVMVQTTANVQKTTDAIANNNVAGTVAALSAKEALGRIKQRQQNFDERLAANEKSSDAFSDDALKQKLQTAFTAGNDDHKVQEILAKIKTQTGA